jgi:hypothetical protein
MKSDYRIGMSIQAFKEDDLTRLGVGNTADLQKIVPKGAM